MSNTPKYSVSPPKVDAASPKILTYTQEVLILQKILETRDINMAAQCTHTPVNIVSQVAAKYYDTILLIINNTDTAKIINKSYTDVLSKALKANEKIIDLLSRQVDILWKEYTSSANENILIKDYLIQQLMLIQDKISKYIDKNDINYKSNRDYLIKQMSMSSIDNSSNTDDSSYKENVEAVFAKLKAKDDAILRSNRRGITPTNAWTFDACKKNDNGTFTPVKHYTSCDDFSQDTGIDARNISKACRKAYTNENIHKREAFLYRKEYLIQNLHRGSDDGK